MEGEQEEMSMRVLYVEDNPVDADLARRSLAKHMPDCVLEVVSGVAAARERLAAASAFDLVLSDLRLPDGTGLELLAHIRERGLAVAVVMLTGSGDQASAVAALKAGADDYLCKRGDYLDRLAQTLVSALARYHGASARRARPLRVLYVEHNSCDIDLTRRYFAQHAPHLLVDAASSPAEALSRLPRSASEAGHYDVLLLDYRLPELDALDVAKILRQERGLDLPIVLVTGQGSEEVAAQALHLGVDDYLTKHANYLAELPAILEKAYHQAELAREQADLRETTARLTRLLASSPTILYSLAMQGEEPVATWVSDNISRLLGYTVDEALAPGWWLAHLHPEDRARATTGVPVLLAQGCLVHEYRFLHRDGHVLWIHDDLRLLRDAQGGPAEAVGAWHDVTERKRAETQIHALNRLYRVLSNINQIIVRGLEPVRMFREACEIAVRDGGFRMAWIGLKQPESDQVVPVAQAGDAGDYPERIGGGAGPWSGRHGSARRPAGDLQRHCQRPGRGPLAGCRPGPRLRFLGRFPATGARPNPRHFQSLRVGGRFLRRGRTQAPGRTGGRHRLRRGSGGSGGGAQAARRASAAGRDGVRKHRRGGHGDRRGPAHPDGQPGFLRTFGL